MGNISYLSGSSQNGPQSIDASLFEIENSSILFKDAWLQSPPDLIRASKVSSKAMEHFDHVINVIMRARDTKKSQGTYSGSNLETQLKKNQGHIVNPVTLAQQQTMINDGPGNGKLPSAGTPVTLEKLLNKIKHQHHQSANFRIENNKHIFVINVDKPNNRPDSIVEFSVIEFCEHCRVVAPHL